MSAISTINDPYFILQQLPKDEFETFNGNEFNYIVRGFKPSDQSSEAILAVEIYPPCDDDDDRLYYSSSSQAFLKIDKNGNVHFVNIYNLPNSDRKLDLISRNVNFKFNLTINCIKTLTFNKIGYTKDDDQIIKNPKMIFAPCSEPVKIVNMDEPIIFDYEVTQIEWGNDHRRYCHLSNDVNLLSLIKIYYSSEHDIVLCKHIVTEKERIIVEGDFDNRRIRLGFAVFNLCLTYPKEQRLRDWQFIETDKMKLDLQIGKFYKTSENRTVKIIACEDQLFIGMYPHQDSTTFTLDNDVDVFECAHDVWTSKDGTIIVGKDTTVYCIIYKSGCGALISRVFEDKDEAYCKAAELNVQVHSIKI